MPEINIVPAGTQGAYTPWGGCKLFMESKDHQVILYGSGGSGKTTACCWTMLMRCLMYPGCKFLFCRTSYTALIKTGIETWERVLQEAGCKMGNKKGEIKKYGDSKPTRYVFPYARREGKDKDGNPRIYEGQSIIDVASIENARDHLGGEYDYIYLNQPETAQEKDWEYLCTRADGRYNHAPWPQIFGDPNPDGRRHWIKVGGYELEKGESPNSASARWRIIQSTVKDNPVMWDQVNNCFTDEGELRIGRARKGLSPIMQKRMIDGEWADFEGLVYAESWDRDKHVINLEQLNRDYPNWRTWDTYWGIDFGYDDPFVCSVMAKHPDHELYINTRLIYMTNKTIIEHVESIQEILNESGRPNLIVADRNPQEIAILSQALNLNIISAKKGAGSVKTRINVLTDMLKNDQLLFLDSALLEEDPRLMAKHKPHNFADEVEGITWRSNTKLVNDMPTDGDDHQENCLGYLFSHIKADQRIVPFIYTF